MEEKFNTCKLKTNSKTIIITGAESTGKSELTKWLAARFGVPYIPEFARTHIESLDRKYTYDDVEYIAKKQIQQLNEFKNSELPWIFSDTWLIITKIWFEEVFEKVPSWIESEIRKAEIDLFLVCDTDIPWIPDSVRENGGERRDYLQKRYIEIISGYGFKYEIVSGEKEARFQNALAKLKKLTGKVTAYNQNR